MNVGTFHSREEVGRPAVWNKPVAGDVIALIRATAALGAFFKMKRT
jgi:hypothetical protein